MQALHHHHTTAAYYTVTEAAKILGSRNPMAFFVNSDGSLTEHSIELLKADGLYDPKDSFDEVVRKTQESWIAVLRGRGNLERTDLVDKKGMKEQLDIVGSIISDLHLVEERTPTLEHYNYAVCLGSFLENIRERYVQLIKAWESGVRFDSLVFLTGERTLRKGEGEQDDIRLLTESKIPGLKLRDGWQLPESYPYETETDLVRLIIGQVELPEDMAEALKDKIIVVDAPKDDQPRPDTAKTVSTWLKEHSPEPGSVLATSSPLIWAYQDITVRNVLGKDYPLETIADAHPNPKMHPAVVTLVKDTFAKCFFEIQKTQKAFEEAKKESRIIPISSNG